MMKKLGFRTVMPSNPVSYFHSDGYLRHNARRLEHLSSLNINVAGMSVLEVGAGIGDHSHYYIDRQCKITITEARSENLRYLKKRYPEENIQFLDMENPVDIETSPFDIVHCYGLLYHLSNPQEALRFLSKNTSKMFFCETCVSFGETQEINLIGEKKSNATQAYSGTGCRPTRTWIFKELQQLFEYVYIPKTQPNHEEFPLDWNAPKEHQALLKRAIFIGARQPIENQLLDTSLPGRQIRH
jgi:SAM-dependent methyltransferase